MVELNKILNVDCLEGLKGLPDNCVDCIIADPPYSTPVVTSFGRGIVKNVADLSLQETYFGLLCREIERVLKPEGRLFVFCDDKYYPILFRVFYSWKNSALVVWDKGRINMGVPFRKRHELIFYACRLAYIPRNRGISSILKFDPVGKERIYGSQKPLDLVTFLIEEFSEEGDVILDMFMGSGTTAIAAFQAKRRFIGFELNKESVEIAEKRIRSFFNQQKLRGDYNG